MQNDIRLQYFRLQPISFFIRPGCSKCKAAYQAIEKVIRDNNLDIRLSKIEDISEIMNYNIMGTPAVVVNGSVKIKGHVPSESEIKQMLGI